MKRTHLFVATLVASAAFSVFIFRSDIRAADSGAASITTAGAAGSAINLGKQASKATGELAGVAGYTKYAAEVTGVGPNDWSQWGGSSIRNNTPEAKNIPAEWNLGKLDPNTGAWLNQGAKNIKWAAQLGFKSYGNPVVANGHVYVGTNNGAGYSSVIPPTSISACCCASTKKPASCCGKIATKNFPPAA